MSQLHQTKCINHSSREAAARCPVCRNFFCRECITEHDGKVICASCLLKLAQDTDSKKEKTNGKRMQMPIGLVKALVSMLVLWILFYAAGQFLLLFPDSFHSGDMWKNL